MVDRFAKIYRGLYDDERRGLSNPETEPTFADRVGAAIGVIGPDPRRILDCGCGSGGAVERFVSAGHFVVGVDISDSGIELARQKVPAARFELVDAGAALPFAPESFDVCFSSEVIEHVFDVEGFLEEIHRILSPGGMLILTTPYHGWIKNLIVATYDFERHYDPAGQHIRFFTRESLTRCLARAGFDVNGFRGIGRRWPIWKSMFLTARKLAGPASR